MFSGIVRLLLLGIAFHAVFLWSIFDIYFVSPVVSVSQRFGPPQKDAPAKRVVVISADGLRADKLFQLYPDPPFEHVAPLPDFEAYQVVAPPSSDDSVDVVPEGYTTPAPYLRSLILNGQAAWGVSHTRVPTESRPGHVALLAGMYEDVSAVLKGWQVNPVHFDSTLNQSAHAWAYGSPDIVPMFRLGATPQSKVDMACYDAHEEDFSKDAVELDTWVLERVRDLLSNATTQPELRQQLEQPGNLFFLHLLGLDTTGHSYRPHSPDYYRNLAAVDRIVETVVFMLHQYFKKLDGDEETSQTAFILTADHGMSNIGNHGDGHPDNTRTPIVAWGAGVETQPAVTAEASNHDGYSAPWGLSHLPRQDMDQADVAALISALVGNPFPGNSVGVLPHNYVRASSSYKVSALLENARSIVEQFIVQHDMKAAQTGKRFRPFPSASPSDLLHRYYTAQEALRQDATKGSDDVQKEAAELIQVSLQGLRYLHTYEWLVLRIIVVVGYVAWMTTTATYLIRHFILATDSQLQQPAQRTPFWYTWLYTTPFIVLASNFSFGSTPPSHFVYLAFSAYLTSLTAKDSQPLRLLLSRAWNKPAFAMAVSSALVAALEAMVVGYFERRSWTLALAAFALSGWSWIEGKHKRVMWTIVCLLTSVFTLLPVEKGENLLLIGGSGFLFLLPVLLYSQYTENERTQTILFAQMCLIAIGSVVAMLASASLQAKKGLPLFYQASGWLLLASSIVTPPYLVKTVPDRVERLILLIFSFVPIFIILTISYEGLFYFAFSSLLLCWLYVEPRPQAPITKPEEAAAAAVDASKLPPLQRKRKQAESQAKKALGLADLRRACILLAFLHIAFFGTGNVASISSFYLEPVYRLVPVFSPFLMATLLLFKIMIPFLILASTVTVLTQELGLPTFAIFLLALCVSDVLTLNFFFMVQDQGSWLDIGQSISHFAISNLMLVFCGMLNLIGASLMQ